MAKDAEEPVVDTWDERDEVLRRRYDEALTAGMNDHDAHLFASAATDIGLLRNAVRKGCPPTLIARIVL